MAATDTPSLITDLMAAALTWTGEHAQEHRELVTKLYAAAKSESKVALEELARLWGEAEKARQDLHALQHQYVLLHQSQNVAVPVGEQKIITRQPAKVLGKEKTQVTPSIDLTGDDTNTGDRASVDKPTHPLLQQSGVPEANPAIATSQDPQLTLEPRPVVKRERSPSADAGDSPSPAKRPSNGTGRRPVCERCVTNYRRATCDGKGRCNHCTRDRADHCVYMRCRNPDCTPDCRRVHAEQWDGEVEPQRAVKGFNLPYGRVRS